MSAEDTARAPKPAGGGNDQIPKPKRRPPKINSRTAARVASVQALYQMDMAGTDVTDVVREFTGIRFPVADPEATIAGADPAFFSELVRGVVRRQRDLDPVIDNLLATGWRLVRIDSILRAILRSGGYELLERHDVPARVVINEYLNVAHAFFEDDEPKVVNGVLDRLARRYRSSEFSASQGQPNKSPDAPQSAAGIENKEKDEDGSRE